MKRKRAFLMAACIVLLLGTACGNATAAPTVIASTPSPALTATAASTPSPAPSATITPTPLPPMPEGGEKYDSDRQHWMKTEGSSDLYYIEEAGEWATPVNKKPIWLIDSANIPQDLASGLLQDLKAMPLYYYRLPDSEPTIYSVEEPEAYDAMSFGEQFILQKDSWRSPQERTLMLLARRANSVDEKHLTAAMLRETLRQVSQDSLALPLNVPVVAKDNSQVTTRYWSPARSVDIIQVPWKSVADDNSFFGRLSLSFRWKLDVRGGADPAQPGNLLVFYASPYDQRVKNDWNEADVLMLGPIFVALINQKEPLLDYVTGQGRDLPNFDGERAMIHDTKGISYNEMDASRHYEEMKEFALSASVSGDWGAPFLEYQCIQYDKGGRPSAVYCYAPTNYLVSKASQ